MKFDLRLLAIPIALAVIAGILFAVLYGPMEKGKQSAIQAEIHNWNWNNYPIPCKAFSLRRGRLDQAAWNETKKAPEWFKTKFKRNLYHTNGPGIPVFVHAAKKCVSPRVGWIERTPDFGEPTTRFDAFICVSMIREAKYYPGSDESIRIMGRLGVFGHVLHELLHPFMGDRVQHSHPKHGDGLMLAKPKYLHIGPVVKGIFKRIDKHCGGTK